MTDMIEMKTAELIGPALNWAVAIATGFNPRSGDQLVLERWSGPCFSTLTLIHINFGPVTLGPIEGLYSPSTTWSQCGPLIDHHKPWLSPPVPDPIPEEPYGWDAEIYDADGNEVIGHAIGCPTALIAVCRAVVLAKLGDVVSIPAILAQAVHP